jgi:hypothetical protein
VPTSARPPINKLPPTVDDLIDELDTLVPELVPSADTPLLEIQRHAGKRELVLFLKRLRDRRAAPPAPVTRKR